MCELSWHGVGLSGETDGPLAVVGAAETVALLQAREGKGREGME